MDKRAKFSGRGFPLQTWRQAVQLVCLLLAQLFCWFSNHVSIWVLQPFAQHLKFRTLCPAFALCSLHAQQSLVTLHLQSHYLFVPPLLNPIIYTNETREIHKEIIRIISQNNIWACPDQPQSAAPPPWGGAANPTSCTWTAAWWWKLLSCGCSGDVSSSSQTHTIPSRPCRFFSVSDFSGCLCPYSLCRQPSPPLPTKRLCAFLCSKGSVMVWSLPYNLDLAT